MPLFIGRRRRLTGPVKSALPTPAHADGKRLRRQRIDKALHALIISAMRPRRLDRRTREVLVTAVGDSASFEFWREFLTGAEDRKSVAALEKDVWIDNWNQDPKPFVWRKTAEEMLVSSPIYIEDSRTSTLVQRKSTRLYHMCCC